MRSTFRILFYLKRNAPKSNGLAPPTPVNEEQEQKQDSDSNKVVQPNSIPTYKGIRI